MKVTPIKTRLFQIKEDLFSFIADVVPALENGAILVVTSKIVALSQGRVVAGGEGVKEMWIRKESERVIPTPWGFATRYNGEWCLSAGIDESNADDQLILMPEKPYDVALELWKSLKDHYAISWLGIIITDSRSTPLRFGTIGSAVGFAGIDGMKNYIGTPDLFGKTLRSTRVNIADSLSAAAVLTMGEADESMPIAVVTDFAADFWSEARTPDSIRTDPENDIYAAVFRDVI